MAEAAGFAGTKNSTNPVAAKQSKVQLSVLRRVRCGRAVRKLKCSGIIKIHVASI